MSKVALVGLAVAAACWEPRLSHADDSEIDLTVRPPVTMSMRVGQATGPAADDDTEDGDDPVPPAARRDDRFLDFGSRADREPPPRLEDKLTVRVTLGFGLDGGQLACDAQGDCTPPPSGISSEEFDQQYYSKLRTYAYGDAVIGTRGIVAPSLNTYFASSFRFDQSGVLSSAVPSIHDASSVEPVLVRAGYIETDGFFDHPRLRPIYVRAGRQFKYGPAIAHFDGLSVGYDSRALSLALFSGTRVSLYGFDADLLDQRGLISGIDARFDIHELKRVPLVLSGSMLWFDGERHFEGGLALRWSRDSVVRASGRISGRDFTSQRLSVRTRVSKVTTVSFDVESQSARAWPYDILLSRPDADYPDPTVPRRYLNFGQQLPRVHLNLRAGTVLLDNIDVLLRLGSAIDRTGELEADGDSASYLEGGVAFEVRLRRALGLGASILTRTFSRADPLPMTATADPDPLPVELGRIGDDDFVEGGITLRFEPGRKSFAGLAELYGRLYDWQSPYVPQEDETELRAGGRFGISVWVNDRLRMQLEYDTAFAPEYLAPEISSLKTLRVLAEGTF